jgi:hypothetical protein
MYQGSILEITTSNLDFGLAILTEFSGDFHLSLQEDVRID